MKILTVKRFAACAFVFSLAAYLAVYGYYRTIGHDGVLRYIGVPGDGGGRESFSGKSIVTDIKDLTGVPVATMFNSVYWPIAFLDGHLTGQHIQFKDYVAQPLFNSIDLDPSMIEIVECDWIDLSDPYVNDGEQGGTDPPAASEGYQKSQADLKSRSL